MLHDADYISKHDEVVQLSSNRQHPKTVAYLIDPAPTICNEEKIIKDHIICS